MPNAVLVVDDSTTIQKVIKIAFARYQVDVTTATSLDDAIEKLQTQEFFLILADATIPGVENCQDFKMLSELAPQCPIIILSGSYDGIEPNEFFENGFSHIIKKPFESNQLIAKIEEVVGKKLPMGSADQNHSQDDQEEPPETVFDLDEISATELTPPLAAEENPGAKQNSIPKPPLAKQPPAGLIEPFLSKEMAGIIRQAVEEYCYKHFPPLAKDIITAEIKRLTEEKARMLIDN